MRKKFTLTIMPNGKSILSSRDELTEEEAYRIKQAWTRWLDGDGFQSMVIGSTDVVQVTTIELELPV